ncbi:unnamed protein product, partial [Effrenium voratum]
RFVRFIEAHLVDLFVPMSSKQRTASPVPKTAAKAKEPARAPRKQPEEPPAQVQGPPEQAHPVQAEPASIQPPVEKPVLKTRGSIYALEPNKKWVQPSLAFVKYGVTMCLTAGLCFLWQPSFKTLRLVYTLIGAGLLLYRIYYYAYKEWMLYFIDLCFVNSILLIWSLWYCTEGQCSKEWLLAVYMMAQGPVAGATFPLQTPLTLHHPEAFESFFLHASPMWLSYAVRWRWTDALLQPTPSVGELVSAGLYKLYLPWSISYLSFLLLQPFLPDRLAGLETLMDGFIFPAATKTLRLQGKRKNYLSFAPTVMAATLAHALLSASGLLAAALAFQHHSVQVAWIACVVLGCLVSGFRFYHLCANPELEPAGFYKGFLHMILAWAVVLPTYFYAEMTAQDV